ncbi:MAG: alpha-E domain-containing protein [Rhodocyclaceae bacterium]|nr:alpha-E domain-containing protein [Rhodocyclaceae bacterium]
MLSRTASNLYWMARYIERAENTARTLNIAHQKAMLASARATSASEWAQPLLISGRHDAYVAAGRPVDAPSVTTFMAIDPDNPSSIHACIRQARENARAVRSTITSEMWEVVNTTWLGLRDFDASVFRSREAGRFLAWVKERSHLFRGVTFGTMLHDEAFRFNRLGTFVERGDNTVRILDVSYHALVEDEEIPQAEYYHWTALLRSVSALEAYRKVYRDHIDPERVAQFLMLDRQLPRSLMYCIHEVYMALESVIGNVSSPPMRTVMGLYAQLDNANVADLRNAAGHLDLQPLLRRLETLAQQIAEAVFAPRPAGTPSPRTLLKGAA